MGIVNATFGLLGQDGVQPRRVQLVTTDNLATITKAGYLTEQGINPSFIYPTDIFDTIYNYNVNTTVGTYIELLPTIFNGVITLNAASSTIVIPTIANHIATYINTEGGLSEDPATAISGGNIQAGLSGTAGYLASFPATASRGSLRLTAVANTGNTVTVISNAAMGQASTISIPDPAGATADFVLAPAALVNNNLIKASGTVGLIVDAGIAASAVMLNNAVNTLTGSGQIILVKASAAESGNAVTASGNAGVITTSSLTTAGGSSYAITWTNTLITSTSVILLTIMGGTNTTENITLKATSGSGTSTLTIYNNTAATALDGTILIGYAVF